MEEIIVTKTSFDKRGEYAERTEKVRVPELNEMMGLVNDQVAVFEVQQLSLSTYLSARAEINDRVKNLVEGILAASVKKEEVEEEVKKAWKEKSPEVLYRIEIVLNGVKNPQLKRSDVIFLCDKFPMVINRLVERIIYLTEKGADLKKNSQE